MALNGFQKRRKVSLLQERRRAAADDESGRKCLHSFFAGAEKRMNNEREEGRGRKTFARHIERRTV